jgi:phosphoribosylamine---glycine ligase
VRLLVIDPEGASGLDLAIRAQKDGHEVKLAIKPTERNKLVGKGFVPVVNDPREWFRWSNLVVCCYNNLYLRDLDAHRAAGGKVVGASQETAQWEINRQVGQEVLRKAGIPVIPSKEFSDYDSAIAHVKRTMQRYVSKPTGDGTGTVDKALSYVSSGPDDMVFMLERWKRLNKLKTPFILQEFVSGVEMGVAGWFGPGGWNEGWEENFEFKKLMAGDLGPGTGEQGTILRYVRSSKLAKKMLWPLTERLEKLGYVGDIDVNCIIDEKGQAWPLEFTMRLGWPAFNLQVALCQGDPAQWLMDLTSGIDSRSLLLDKVACGVVMSIPDYPYSKATGKETSGIPIYGLRDGLWKHVHPCQMACLPAPVTVDGKIVNLPQPVTAGDYVLVMTAVADTVKDAALTCYRRLERLTVPNSPMWRSDIGKRLAKQLPKIQTQGYATNLMYSQDR